MSTNSPEHLKPIYFAGELLPKWARLLDIATRLCAVSLETQNWFARLTNHNGVEDSRTVLEHCQSLRKSLMTHRATLERELRHAHNDTQPSQIVNAWLYSLDTMIQQAQSQPTCSWQIENAPDFSPDDPTGGDIELRRV